MPRLLHRSQIAVHVKRVICVQHVKNPKLRHVDLARWCFTRFEIRPDRSTISRVLKGADRWKVATANHNTVRVRAGAQPELEQAMCRWIRNAGPAGVPLTLATIRDHVEIIARDMAIPDMFRCSVGWVRRAIRRNGIRCRSATGEAADSDHAAVRTCRDKLPHMLMHLAVRTRDVYNFDESALYLSVLPRKTYGASRVAGRKVAKERLTVGLLVNAEGTHAFCPLVISKAKRPRDFLPDFDPEEHVYWRNNAKGWMTAPPLDQGLIAMTKIRYRQHWLHVFTQLWLEAGGTAPSARFRPNMRDVVGRVNDAWMNIPTRTIQHCWWRTGCLLRPWAMELAFVGAEGLNNKGPNGSVNTSLDIGLADDILDVGIMIGRLGLGASAMPADEFVAVDNDQPTCSEPGPDPLAIEPADPYSRA
ncbi:unnamed protein product [Closterium sp. Yama58-4]|nr:unnamed protein product [Closterium sp. Yama58-4]